MARNVLRNWWWPAYVFLYPLAFWPGSPTIAASFQAHAYLTVAFLVGGLILELLDLERVRVRSWRTFVGGVRESPAIALAAGFAVWVLVAALCAPRPVFAVTGALSDGTDGALWQSALVLVFVLVYVRTSRVPGTSRRIAAAVVAAATVLGVAAAVEVVVGHGLLFTISQGDLPMVVFPQKGHLAGMLTLGAGTAVALWPVLGLPVLSFSVGLTLNRSAGIAMLLGALVPLVRGVPRLRQAAILLAIAAVGLLAGWQVVTRTLPTEKPIVSGRTLNSRSYYFRSAWRGILARPILGWGGGNFSLYWPEFLTGAELQDFVAAEWSYPEVLSVTANGDSWPFLVVRNEAGVVRSLRVINFKTHNQLLEAALMWGLPGAAIFLVILVLGLLRGLTRGEPLAWGLLVYFLFLQLWFIIPQTQGVVWAMLAASLGAPRRPPETQGQDS